MEWGILIGLAIGLLLGILLPRKSVGVLQIDRSNLDKDTYRFVIDDIDGLSKKRRITLKVDNNAMLASPIMERNSSN
jgi:hypothetical protein